MGEVPPLIWLLLFEETKKGGVTEGFLPDIFAVGPGREFRRGGVDFPKNVGVFLYLYIREQENLLLLHVGNC